MNCSDIKKLLSGYIDEDLGEKENWLVSEHLKICADCSNELDLLKETVSLLKAKEPVEPPVDFVVEVRKKIEQRRWWKEAVKVIFYPLHIKIPAEAIATVVVVCVLYYIYQQPSPVKPGRELIEKIAPTEATITKSETQKPVPVPMPEPAPAPTSARAPVPAPAPIPDSVLVGTTQISTRMETAERGGKHPLETDYKKGAMLYREAATEESAEGYVQQASREDKISPEQIELLLTLKKPAKDMLQIEKYISILDAKKIGESYNEATREKIIIIQIKGRNYPKLTKKLIRIGTIKLQDVKETKGENLIVKLRIR